MKPRAIELEGFGSYRSLTRIDLTGEELLAIVGANGAGKTTLCDAFTWALYGKVRADIDQVVTLHAKRGFARVEMEIDGVLYAVQREREVGRRTAAWLYQLDGAGQWQRLSGPGAREVNAAVSDLVGLSAEAWEVAVALAQGGAGRFSNAGPAGRKKILSELIGLARFDVLAKEARSQVANAERTRSETAGAADALDTQLARRVDDETSCAHAEAELQTTTSRRADLSRRLAKAELAAQQAAAARQLVDSLAGRISERRKAADLERQVIEAGIRELTHSRGAIDMEIEAARQGELRRGTLQAAVDKAAEVAEQMAAVVANADRQIAELERAEADLDSRRRQAEADEAGWAVTIDHLRRRLDVLAHIDGSCTVCNSPLDPTRQAELHREAQAEMSQARQHRQHAADSIKACADQAAAIRRQIAQQNVTRQKASDRRNRAEAERDAALRQIAELADGPNLEELATKRRQCDTQIADAEKRLAVHEQAAAVEIAALEAELADAKTNSVGVEQLHDVCAGLRAEDSRLAQTETHLHGQLGALRERVARHHEAAAQREQLAAALDDLDTTIRRFGLLAEALGPKGVPALLLEGARAELEVEANRVLADFSGKPLRVELRSVAETSGGETETLDVIVHSSDGARDYETFSGGERLRVDIALRVGMAAALSRRRARRVGMMLLDEPCAALDGAGVHDLIEVLRDVRVRCPFVAVVTHDPMVAAAFPARLEVACDADGSRVSITAC